MADAVTTPTRIAFSSAGAVRRRPFAQPTEPARVYFNEAARLSYANLRDSLAAIEPPPVIGLKADDLDITLVAHHAEQVLGAVTQYVRALVGDTAWRAPCHIHDETGLLADAAADIVGELRKSAEALRLEANSAACLKPNRPEVPRRGGRR